ncbi:hypothetical protein [Pseudoalteromonas sp. MTN2-4]
MPYHQKLTLFRAPIMMRKPRSSSILLALARQ